MKMIHVVFVISLASLTALVILGATSATASMAAPQTTFSVTSTADAVDNNLGDNQCHAALPGNPCTLRAAIQQADALDGGSTIMLPAGTYTLTIAGTGEDAAATGDLDVLHTLTLQGAGATATIINADGIDRVFDIPPTAQLTISGVTIENGRDNGYTGGGILNRGSLTLIDDVVYHNHTTTSGGGIASIGVLILSNTHIISNSSYFYGGGIESGGPLHITGGSLVSNTTDYGGGGPDAGKVGGFGKAHVAGKQATGLGASGSGGGNQICGASFEST